MASETPIDSQAKGIEPANRLAVETQEEARPPSLTADGKRAGIYPKWFRGKWLTRRSAVHFVLMLILLLGPWIDVGGHPAIRIDIVHRRIYFWGLKLFATDGWYLLFATTGFFFSIFFVTALFGRAWCGWTCPQTVFLESLIRPIERFFDGPPSSQRKLATAAWSSSKLLRRLLKWGIFAIIAGAIGTTVVAYFLGRDGVIEAQFSPTTHPAGFAFFFAISALLFFDFAWFREQTCLVVCPYGRFQSVMLDPDSLSVAYDTKRGEPRGKSKQKQDTLGDCVDCKRCVNVCPTGIDIRNGLQMECVQCMACIDACDDMMHRMGRAPQLISLRSERQISEGVKDNNRFWKRAFRARVLVYASMLVVIATSFLLTVSKHQDVDFRLGRQPSAPFSLLEDGRVRNGFQLRITNRSDEQQRYRIALSEGSNNEQTELISPLSTYTVAADSVQHFPFFVVGPVEPDPTANGKRPLQFDLFDENTGERVEQTLSIPLIAQSAPTNSSAPSPTGQDKP